MGQPPTYTRQYNFNDFATTSPSTPLPGDKVDAELNAAKLTLDELNANIAKIQRDDGKLGNTVVHKDAFDAGALALMSTGSMTPRGSWSAGVSYVVSDLADFNNATYLATAAHTSASAFTTDLAASRWILLANAAISGTANSVDKFSGTGSQTAFTLTSSYASNTSVLVFVNGALRNPGDDYSISGSTLTFVTAPSVPSVSGNENVIAWGPSVVAQAASDAALASSSNASGFADEAQSWASKVNGIVESTDYSSKAWSIGGTGVDAGSGSAKDWATKTGGTVGNTSEYSAKYWATSSNVATVVGAVSAINLVSGSITNVNNVGGSISNVNSLATALGTATVFAVTVASVGGSNKFHLDGTTAPTLSLFRGNTYTFDLSNSSNSGHPLIFKTSAGAGYTTGVVTTGTAGSSGAKVTFTIAADAPSALVYACSVHGNGMGNTIAIASSNLSTVATNIASVNTTATNIANVNTVAGVASTMAAAATNATNAASSATAAANSAAAAATALDSFDDRYLGSKSSEPSVDNDGNALVSGALYFNSTSNGMKVYDGGSWINASSAGSVSLLDYEYTATAGQTTFSGSDNNSATLAYAAGNLIVTLNGIVLDNGSDYTATSGTSIVLASGAALNDHLAVVAFKSFTAADTVPASTGGTFAGNVSVTGTISTTGKVALPATLGSANQVLTVNGGASAAAWASPAVGFAHTLNSGNPAVTTNPSAVGHMWINTTSGEALICTDATTNDNVWISVGVGTTIIESFSAAGGVKTTYGIYTVHTFLSSANFVMSGSKTFDYLIVGAGGGGGCANGGGGGGGAGGLLTGQVTKTSATYSVVVGAGGAGGAITNQGEVGVAGTNSSVFGLTSIGGGGGGGSVSNSGGNGGSGGGAARYASGTRGAGTSGQGNNGGSVIVSNTGGGGGGAGAVGGNSSTGNGGNGGVGLSNSLRTGSGVFYAGGGGGGIEATNQHGTGGNGGGGDAGDWNEAPVAGTANTGGGGGGSGDYDNNALAGATGGSGIVIIRYET